MVQNRFDLPAGTMQEHDEADTAQEHPAEWAEVLPLAYLALR
jgi:hypothetical protein